MMLQDWLLLLFLAAIALISLVIIVDHIRTEIDWYIWNKNQNRRKK